MGGYGDVLAMEEQAKIDKEQAAQNARLYNPDGSAKSNDFVMPKLPKSAFPADLSAGKELRVNEGKVSSVRGQMSKDVGRLEATLSQLVSEGAFGGAVGGWSTADAFGSNATNAYEGITQFIQALNSAYGMVGGHLAKSVINYSDADTTTASAASRIGAESAPGGSLSG